ncbi:MAG: AAA family ATPase, partial [Cyanobacteria bacterium]|nr:AAA family ATPase [Cyanobacteriota bacterium]
MTHSIVIDALKSYVSSLLVEQTFRTARHNQDASVVRQAATVLFADVSGFTNLTEQFAQQGPAGVETLTEHLNAYFGELIELVYNHGGDVIKFVGDALLCFWPAGSDADREAALALSTHRAAQCALAMQAQLNQYSIEGKPLSLRVGLGSGEVTIALVGPSSHREIIVGGHPLVAMATAEGQARPGEVILAQRTWELLKDKGTGTPLSADGIRLEALHQHLPLVPASAPEIPARQVDTLLAYLPKLIQSHLQTGQTQWLSELRRITVVFVNVLSLDYEAADILGLLQQIMAAVQQVVQQYEGVLNKFLVEDKGSIILMGFGLPPYAHEDDAIRGVQAAIALLGHLQQLGLQSCIGITTGRSYCGAIGSDRRREYSVLGDTVNLAARLMQASTDGILCDDTTYLAARSQLVFESLPAIRVKGKARPISVYRPNETWTLSHALQMQVLSTQSYGLPQAEMVGRRAQQQILANQLRDLQQGQGSVVLIEGEPGIGKSRLLTAFLQFSQASKVRLLAGAGIAIVKHKPYHAWCSVLIRLLQLNLLASVEQQRQQFLEWLEAQPQSIQQRGPLLTPMLPFDVPDTEYTQALTGPERSEATRNLVVELLQNATQTAPTVLVLDDAHWLDSASWALLLAVSQTVTSVLTVVATRPMESTVTEYEQLCQVSGLRHLRLAPLSSQEILVLVRQRLGVNTLPNLVIQLIQKAQGNPFFCEELVYSLRDRGLIVITASDCRLAAGVTDFDAVSIPDTIEGLVTSRIDRLGSEQQITLKVASVIGRIFPYTVLHEVYPVASEKPKLLDHLKTLESLDLTYLHHPEPDLAHSFRHITTQEVAYNLMLFAQRRQLHQRIAEWYEHTYRSHLAPF